MRPSDAEIIERLSEAVDKTWLMRSQPIVNPDLERLRVAAVIDILRKYDDIPEGQFSEWECGWWNGVLESLRWVLGDDLGDLDILLGRDETMDEHDRTPS